MKTPSTISGYRPNEVLYPDMVMSRDTQQKGQVEDVMRITNLDDLGRSICKGQ